MQRSTRDCFSPGIFVFFFFAVIVVVVLGRLFSLLDGSDISPGNFAELPSSHFADNP
jgi:hypothetical protein